MKFLRRFLLFFVFSVFFAQCSGQGTTIAGNPDGSGDTATADFDVTTSGILYSAVSSGQITVTSSLDAVTFPTGYSSADLVVTILVNGSLQETLSSDDFSSSSAELNINLSKGLSVTSTTSNLFSATVSSASGNQVLALFSIGSSEPPVILSGEVGSSAVNPSKVTASASSDTDLSALSTGLSALETGDVSSAEAAYCDAFEGGSGNSQVAFGCYLSQLLNLPETSEFATLLTSFGESSVDVETLILEGIFKSPISDTGFDDFSYTEYSSLPLNGIFASSSLSKTGMLASLIKRLKDSSTSESALRGELQNLVQHFEMMESLLTIVLSDASFTFTIPSELFYTDADMVASYNDAMLFMAKTKLVIVGLNISAAYKTGLNPNKVLKSSGTEFDNQILTADLNGTGETIGSVTVDSVAFLTMEDESLITGSRARCEDGLDYLVEGLTNLKNGESSALFDQSFDRFSMSIPQDVAKDLQRSIASSGMLTLSVVGDHSGHTLKLDLDAFFDNPPSASDVTSSDPFVYNSTDDKIEIVEAYFSELLQDVAEY